MTKIFLEKVQRENSNGNREYIMYKTIKNERK